MINTFKKHTPHTTQLQLRRLSNRTKTTDHTTKPNTIFHGYWTVSNTKNGNSFMFNVPSMPFLLSGSTWYENLPNSSSLFPIVCIRHKTDQEVTIKFTCATLPFVYLVKKPWRIQLANHFPIKALYIFRALGIY